MDITGSTITVDFDGNIVKYTPKDYGAIKHGYAISVHKAQGSQFGKVVLFDESDCFRAYKKQWLYTAITRASEKLIIIK